MKKLFYIGMMAIGLLLVASVSGCIHFYDYNSHYRSYNKPQRTHSSHYRTPHNHHSPHQSYTQRQANFHYHTYRSGSRNVTVMCYNNHQMIYSRRATTQRPSHHSSHNRRPHRRTRHRRHR